MKISEIIDKLEAYHGPLEPEAQNVRHRAIRRSGSDLHRNRVVLLPNGRGHS